ncbi:MAG: hypothetical protein JWO87_2389 [Phycisphaerales bacterium]|nr:hypothetical protein [Phycisphaerales bacterium]
MKLWPGCVPGGSAMPLESSESATRLSGPRKSGRERRNSTRTPLGVTGTMVFANGQYPVIVRDVSSTGAGLIAKRKVKRGEQFILVMRASKGHPAVNSLCIVVESRIIPRGGFFFGVIRLRELPSAEPAAAGPATGAAAAPTETKPAA